MRHNFVLFGDCIGLCMMKRGINTLLWSYFSMAMYNEMKNVSIGCEGILCGEREDMYQFTCNFMAEMHLVDHFDIGQESALFSTPMY